MNNFVAVPMNEENRKVTRESHGSNRYRSRVTFVSRPSPITILQSHEELQAAYGLMVSMYICFLFMTFINYAIDPHWRSVDVLFLSEQLSTLHYCLATWILLHIVGYLVIYPINNLTYHQSFNRPLCLLIIVIALVICLVVPPYVIIHNQVRFLLTFMLIVEQVRLLMKYISYSVENTVRQENLKEHVESMYLNQCLVLETPNINNNSSKKSYEKNVLSTDERVMKLTQETAEPNVDKFTYFLFAPTLIYRPCYPRASGPINWFKVILYGAEFFAFWFLGLQMLTKGLLPVYEKVTHQPIKLSAVTLEWYKCGIYALTMFFGLGYGFLHCWLNMWAEMLQFADRQFYREWFLCDSVGQFWRRWNYMVHVWFSEYVYFPLVSLTSNRAFSISCVYLISGIAHEYATGFALRIFLPVFAVTMFFCFPLTYLINFGPKNNKVIVITILHFILWVSITNITFIYGIELFSRDVCPPPDVSAPWHDIFIPRFISCVTITY